MAAVEKKATGQYAVGSEKPASVVAVAEEKCDRASSAATVVAVEEEKQKQDEKRPSAIRRIGNVFHDHQKCLNCYHYGFPCADCQQFDRSYSTWMTFEEYRAVAFGGEYADESYDQYLVRCVADGLYLIPRAVEEGPNHSRTQNTDQEGEDDAENDGEDDVENDDEPEIYREMENKLRFCE